VLSGLSLLPYNQVSNFVQINAIPYIAPKERKSWLGDHRTELLLPIHLLGNVAPKNSVTSREIRPRGTLLVAACKGAIFGAHVEELEGDRIILKLHLIK
jgi:hypothetical protein